MPSNGSLSDYKHLKIFSVLIILKIINIKISPSKNSAYYVFSARVTIVHIITLYVLIIGLKPHWIAGVSIISGTLSSASGAISDLNVVS